MDEIKDPPAQMAKQGRVHMDGDDDLRDLPKGLSLAGRMVWFLTRGCNIYQASRACSIPLRLGQEIAARPLTQETIRRLRSMALKLPGEGSVVITAKQFLEWEERQPGEPLQ